MSSLRKPNIVGESPIENAHGEVVGTAKVEKLPNGSIVAHVDASDNPDILWDGFRLGAIRFYEDD